MKIGMIGLGKMGNAIASRIVNAGHEVVGFDPNAQAREFAKKEGIKIVSDVQSIAKEVRVIWLMVPAGEIVDKTIETLISDLQQGDIIIDGGNSKFTDSVRRAKKLREKKIIFLDCGTSGGVPAKKDGFSLMIGGNQEAYKKIEPIFKAVAASQGYAYMGPSGAGHYVKMVHNGIEYGLLQAYAEGFHLLKNGAYKDLNLEKVANVWRHGAVIRSWLLDLADNVFEHEQRFDEIVGTVQEGGTGRWTLEESEKHKIPMPVLKESLRVRRDSREGKTSYATKVIALMREQFGGHTVEKNKKK